MVVDINGNWIKLFSKFMNWEWYKDQNTKSLFIHCLLKANWKDGRFEGVEIKRGSFATSLNTLQKELGLSKQEVRTAIKHLISTQELTQATYPKFSVITIVNYEIYQQVNTTSNTQLTQEQHTFNTGTTPIEEYKNIDDSVCNNTPARENPICHLGSIFKEESCFKCMKKRMCKLPESPSFKLAHHKSFDEWNEEIEQLYLSWSEERKSRGENIDLDIFYYDWLNDRGED